MDSVKDKRTSWGRMAVAEGPGRSLDNPLGGGTAGSGLGGREGRPEWP